MGTWSAVVVSIVGRTARTEQQNVSVQATDTLNTTELVSYNGKRKIGLFWRYHLHTLHLILMTLTVTCPLRVRSFFGVGTCVVCSPGHPFKACIHDHQSFTCDGVDSKAYVCEKLLSD